MPSDFNLTISRHNAPKRWRRVWMMQYSNAGTAYVKERTKANPGRVLIVRDAELL